MKQYSGLRTRLGADPGEHAPLQPTLGSSGDGGSQEVAAAQLAWARHLDCFVADTRREMLEMTASLVKEDAPLAKNRHFVEDIMSRTKKDGYASAVGGAEAGISAIALPIQGGGPVLGSLNLIFFTSSMTPEVAAQRYLRSMKQTVNEIEKRWTAANKARGKN
jgi:DNA-binding IclR family transcriptional regulator